MRKNLRWWRPFLVAALAFGAGIAQAATYYWIGSTGGAWNQAANWSLTEGGAAATSYPKSSSDNAYFTDAAVVTLANSSHDKVGALHINADVTFTGGNILEISSAAYGVSGTGTLILSNAMLMATSAKVPIDVPLVVAGDKANELLHYSKSRVSGNYFYVNGAIRGSGSLAMRSVSTSATSAGSKLAGDNSAFSGLIEIYPYGTGSSHQKTDKPSLVSSAASSANAQWEINVKQNYSSDFKPGTAFFGTANETYKFGALKANFYYTDDDNAYWAANGITLEVGGLNLDSYAKGVCAPKDGVIDWVGETATFTNEISGLARLRLSGGGNLVIGSADGVPAAITFVGNGGVLSLADGVTADVSSKLKDSTVAIRFDDRGVNQTWATGPDSSNTGGFVKRGSGTLTWSAAPAMPVATAIEAGKLAVPFGAQLGQVKIAEGSALTVDATGKTTGIALVVSALEDLAQTNRIEFTGTTAKIVQILGEGNGVSYVINPHDYVWRGEEKGKWSESTNWNPNGTPAESDSVSFPLASAVTVDAVAASLKLVGEDALWLGGSYALSVAMSMTLAGELTLRPNAMGGESGDDAYGAANRLTLTAGTLAAASVSGEGEITVGSGDIVGAAEAGTTNGFVGTLTAKNFTKRGEGVYTLIGQGAFSGTVAIEEGTLRLGTYRDLYNCRFDFDASDEDSMTMSGIAVSSWKSQVGDYVLAFSSGQYAQTTSDYFGGMNSLFFRPDEEGENCSAYVLSPKNAASGCASKSLFLVYRPTGFVSTSEDPYLYGEAEAGGMYYDHASHVVKRKQSGGSASGDTVGIFTRDAYGSSAISDNPWLTFWSDTYFDPDSSNAETLGTLGGNDGFRGAIAEVVAFTNTLTHAEREVTTKQLMCKWGLGYADYLPLKPTASVTMQAGATLDLGGQTVAVADFEGAGVVTNGILNTKSVVQKGGALSIPAVDGAAYTLSHIGDALVLRDAKVGTQKKAVTIKVPRDWSKAGCSGFQAVYCKGTVAWDFPGWSPAPVPIYDEKTGWWSISVGGSALRLR